MKCLVTKLGVSVYNDNLEILGAITLRVKATTNRVMSIKYAEDIVVNCIGDGIKFEDGSKEKEVAKNVTLDVITNGIAGIIALPKYSPINSFNIREPASVIFDLKSLECQEKSIDLLALFQTENDTVKGDLKYLINALSDAKLSTVGDSTLNLNNYHGVYGTLEDILVSILNRGISNTDLQIRTAGTGIKLKGVTPGTCYCSIDATGGTIGVYSDSAQSQKRAEYAGGQWTYV